MYRLKIVPDDTNINFMGPWRYTFGLSMVLVAASIAIFFAIGLNFGIDFRGGTTIRTEATQPVDVGAYREAVAPLGLGDVAISEVYDPTFRPDQHVASRKVDAFNLIALGRRLLARAQIGGPTGGFDAFFVYVEQELRAVFAHHVGAICTRQRLEVIVAAGQIVGAKDVVLWVRCLAGNLGILGHVPIVGGHLKAFFFQHIQVKDHQGRVAGMDLIRQAKEIAIQIATGQRRFKEVIQIGVIAIG